MKLVIIGNGPAATSAIETFRRVDPASEIVLIAREVGPSYSPCPLAEYVEGTVPRASLFWRDEAFYRVYGVTTLWGRTVERVQPAEHQVVLADGETIGYDRLLIAAGASTLRLPIPGFDLEGVFSFKTLADADALLAYLPAARRALVIGAGFIGLEVAQALQRRGLAVTVVEMLDRVLPLMLDEEMAAMVQKRLEENGVTVRLKSQVQALQGKSRRTRSTARGKKPRSSKSRERVTRAVVDQQEIPCDLVINAAGVRPNTQLVAGTEIATDVGIRVDEHMRTTHPDVYAAGDIAQGRDLFGQSRVIATWPNAVAGGQVAGYNLAGWHCHLPGLEDANVVRIFGLPVVSLGRREGDATLRRVQDGVVRKLTLKAGRVVGLQQIGTADNAGLFLGLIKQGRDVQALGETLLDMNFNYGRLLHPTGPLLPRRM